MPKRIQTYQSMKCVICEHKIIGQKYCIRDFKIKETRLEWWIRHVVGLLTFNFWDRRNLHTMLPICNRCGIGLVRKNKRINK